MQPVEGRPEVCRSVDMLAPEGYGEITGGSQRIADLALPRMTAQRVDARVERRVGAFGGFGRERAGDQRRLAPEAEVHGVLLFACSLLLAEFSNSRVA